MPRPLRVFLCHASQDKPAVRELYSALKTQNWIDPWLDKAKILPGQGWRMVIEKAVEDADVVIVCLSNQSVSKEGFVQREIKYSYDIALEKPEETIFLIPLRLDNCVVPRGLRSLHWVDYFGVEKKDSCFDLLEALKLRYDQKMDSEADEIARRQSEKQLQDEAGELVRKDAIEKIKREAREKAEREVRRKKRREFMGRIFKLISSNSRSLGIILFVLILGGFGLNSLIKNPPATTATDSLTPGIGSTMTGKHGETLVYVPAGEFTMGSENGNDNEKPVHNVYLDAFWIDQFEVTNKQYQACVDAGTCEPPSDTSSYTPPSYYGNPEFDNFPVIYVNWDKANRYCEVWTGGDLPTEAQWEKAARGTDGRTYPWGEKIDCNKANYQISCVDDTSAVGSYASGKSPYGLYDMAGNVWEWVNDYYQSDTYVDNASNPQGPLSGEYRVLRGGSWDLNDLFARSANRYWYDPANTGSYIGFRCARSP